MSLAKHKLPRRQPSKRRDSQDTRRRLLDAAKILFSDAGYEATTTKMIAKKAKVNESLIQRYFESKSGLLISLFHHFKEEVDGVESAFPHGETLEDDLYNFFMVRLTVARERHEEMRLIISRAIVDPALAEEMGKKVCGGGMPGLQDRLEFWKKGGAIRDDVDLLSASIGISGYAFVTSFFAQVIFCMDSEALCLKLRQMAGVYARGLGPDDRKAK